MMSPRRRTNRRWEAAPRRDLFADLRREPALTSTLFPLAVLAGLLGLFVTDASPGGLTGGEGFLVGSVATLVVLLGISAIGSCLRDYGWQLN